MATPNCCPSNQFQNSNSKVESSVPVIFPSPLRRSSRIPSQSSPSPTTYDFQGSQSNSNREWISENDSGSNHSEDKRSTEEIIINDNNTPSTEEIIINDNNTPKRNFFKKSPKSSSPVSGVYLGASSGTQSRTKSISQISLIYPICLLVVLVLAIFIGHSRLQDPKPPPLPDQEDVFGMKLMKEIKKIQQLFPLQSNQTWIRFCAAFLGIVEKDPPQPSVLLLIAPNSPEGIETVQCLAEQMARLANYLFGSGKISPKAISVKDTVRIKDDALKRELDERLRVMLQEFIAVVLVNLEQIPPKAAMVLHGFCDNFAAPFRKRIIIITAVFNQNNQPVNSQQVDRQLHGLWDKELGVDKSASLVSRVANSPLFIEPELESNVACSLK